MRPLPSDHLLNFHHTLVQTPVQPDKETDAGVLLPAVQIMHRSLTPAEALLVHQELKTTPNILGYTVRELTRLTDVYIAEVGGAFAGLCFSIDLTLHWTEIAVLYVLPAFRGGGLGKTLFVAALARAEEHQRHIYVLSRNPQVVDWMRENGMTVDDKLWRMPLSVHWYMMRYMASWYRGKESLRKSRQIRQCPPLMQGIKKWK